ncbi:MAG: HAD-IIIA family hydrolase [Candidatus Margulisiibacteriota bacterium]
MGKAVFLDRDGVITKHVLNPFSGAYEAAAREIDLEIFPEAFSALRRLTDNGYKLFLVSNQPDYAKGKTSLSSLKETHKKFDRILKENGIVFTEYYYCYHHPEGIVPDYSFACKCRKPGTLFVEEAKKKYNIDMISSWFVGDRDKDVLCGKSAGLKTVLVEEKDSSWDRGTIDPDYKASNITQAVDIIIEHGKKSR